MRTFLLCLALVGCDRTLDAKDYSSTCTAASECVAVYFGELCQVCGGCANGAIHQSQVAKYESDRQAISRSCGPTPLVACAACRAPMVACTGGRCVVTEP